MFRERREVIVGGLNEIPGITCRMPHGAFYVFPNITGTGMASREIADLLLYEAGVATLAGTSFGAFGEGYIRLSYANAVENISKAVNRIKETLANRSTLSVTAAPVVAQAAVPTKTGVNGRIANGASPNGRRSASGQAKATGGYAATDGAKPARQPTRKK